MGSLSKGLSTLGDAEAYLLHQNKRKTIERKKAGKKKKKQKFQEYIR
jgi:hypothetical protein